MTTNSYNLFSDDEFFQHMLQQRLIMIADAAYLTMCQLADLPAEPFNSEEFAASFTSESEMKDALRVAVRSVQAGRYVPLDALWRAAESKRRVFTVKPVDMRGLEAVPLLTGCGRA